mgnify:CR=1 FL=1
MDMAITKTSVNIFHDAKSRYRALQKIASGVPTTEVARQFGCSPSAVSNLKKRNREQVDAMRSLIEQRTAPIIIERLHRDQTIANRLSRHISDPSHINDTALTEMQDILAFTKDANMMASRALQSIGIFSSPAAINNFGNIQVNQHTVISQYISSKLGDDIEDQLDNLDIIDVGDG